MIVYCMSKERQSVLQEIQKRIWREHHPQSEFVTVVTRQGRSIQPAVNQVIGLVKPSGHRFAFVIHEDCIPMKKMDPEEILKGHTFCGRIDPGDGINMHPSRTWLAIDCTVEGKTWLGYQDKPVTLDGLPMQADDSLRAAMDYCMPGFLHLDSWYKRPDGDEMWARKRDWILSAYSDYAQMPSLPARVISFAKAIVDTGKDLKNVMVSREAWVERLEICSNCDAWNKGKCHYCGCSMRMKTRLQSQDCPIGKWPSIEAHQRSQASS